MQSEKRLNWIGRVRRRWLVLISLGFVGGGLILFAMPSRPNALTMVAGVPEWVELVTEDGEPVFSVNVTLSAAGKWPEPNSAVFFKAGSMRAEGRMREGSREWVPIDCGLIAKHVSAGWDGEGTVFVTEGMDAIRVRVMCAGRSLPWRVEGFLSNWGVQMTSRMRSVLGPPEGRRPRWREMVIETEIPGASQWSTVSQN